jgi:hydroxybutyrate-dimer hydrolase
MPAAAATRCDQLAAQGLVTGATTAERAADALARLHAYGWDAESDEVHALQAFSQVAPAVTASYANAYSRSSVKDKLCGFGFAATDATGAPTAMPQTALAQGFGNFNGVPPTGVVNLVNENDPTGPKRDPISVSPSSGVADWNLDGARCLRNLFTTTSTSDAKAVALKQGLDETRRSGNLRGKPAIIVHGRSDALLPPNHHSRPYTALNKQVEGSASQLSYIEVTNAQHFDAFNGLAGFDARYLPLHVYLNRAMDAMWAKLKNGTALPPSQVVRTVPRGGTTSPAPAITAANVPAIAASPAAGDAITMSGTTLVIPD